MRACLIVSRKEMRDHLRDTRSLIATLLYALMGPLVVMLVSLAPAAAGPRGPAMLLSMASVFALVSAFAGGMQVAVDCTAGERERRSLVPLLLTAVPRLDIVIGKWIAASTLALGSLSATVVAFVVVFARMDAASLGALAPQLSIWVLLGLVPLALLGSAVHLLISSNSRSMKEANGWLSMTVFVPMFVGMFLVFFPSSAGSWWFLAPLVGHQTFITRTLAGQPATLLHGAVLGLVTVALVAPALLAAERATIL